MAYYVPIPSLSAQNQTDSNADFIRKIPVHVESEDINVFPLYCKGEPLLQQISVIHHKDRYLSTYTQYFQELILKYFHEVEQIPIEELVNSSSISLQ